MALKQTEALSVAGISRGLQRWDFPVLTCILFRWMDPSTISVQEFWISAIGSSQCQHVTYKHRGKWCRWPCQTCSWIRVTQRRPEKSMPGNKTRVKTWKVGQIQEVGQIWKTKQVEKSCLVNGEKLSRHRHGTPCREKTWENVRARTMRHHIAPPIGSSAFFFFNSTKSPGWVDKV